MTSLTTLLLQAAISLLLLVQGNPNVDPALREQAIVVANQAIKAATAQQTLSGVRSSVPPPIPVVMPPVKDPGPITSSSITVLYPNGGEQLDNSGRKDSGLIGYITWKSSVITRFPLTPVTITLIDTKGLVVKHVAIAIKDTGTYAWKYDQSIPDGKYKIAIATADKGPTATDMSDVFFTLTGNSNTPDHINSSNSLYGW